jgi:uncharacterized protein YbjT (DUF2867 family)
VRGLKFPSYVVLRPVFFMENLLSAWFLQGDKLMMGIQPTTKLQMIGVEDIGKFGALAFERASQLNGAAIDIAGDSVTLPQAAEILSKALGKRLEFVQLPIAAVRQNSEDMALMLEWFDKGGYEADIAGLAEKYGIRSLTLAEWAARNARG